MVLRRVYVIRYGRLVISYFNTFGQRNITSLYDVGAIFCTTTAVIVMAHIIIVTVSVGAFLVCEATINVWIGDFLVVKQIPYYAYGEFTQGP